MKVKSISVIFSFIIALSFSISSQVFAEGNRYEFERYYHSEISSAKAYLDLTKEQERKHKRHRKHNKVVLIDVRRLREYAAGHPKNSFHVPFPHIVENNDQDPVKFYWEVYKTVKGRLDTQVMTLCRTGARSVLAGNILSNPSSIPGLESAEPFTNVRNIWEGFVGRYKEPNVNPFTGDSGNLNEVLDHEALHHSYLDLNNDDILNEDVADVYSQTSDANPDKDGWRNYQGLPWTTKLKNRYVYLNDVSLYAEFQN